MYEKTICAVIIKSPVVLPDKISASEQPLSSVNGRNGYIVIVLTRSHKTQL
jgi:hypothetical protein